VRRCLVAICHNGPTVFTETAISLMELGYGSRVEDAKQAHGFEAIDFAWERGFPRVDAMRNAIVHKLLQHPASYSHLLFLDADMVWPTDVLTRMLAHHERDVISALYCLKGGTHAPVAMLNPQWNDHIGAEVYDFDTDYREGLSDVREVEVVGMGCTLIRREVLEALKNPWFHYDKNADGWPVVSEDVPFCRKAREAGFRVWFDRSIKCGHVTTKVVTEAWHIASTEGAVEAFMQTVNKATTAAVDRSRTERTMSGPGLAAVPAVCVTAHSATAVDELSHGAEA